MLAVKASSTHRLDCSDDELDVPGELGTGGMDCAAMGAGEFHEGRLVVGHEQCLMDRDRVLRECEDAICPFLVDEERLKVRVPSDEQDRSASIENRAIGLLPRLDLEVAQVGARRHRDDCVGQHLHRVGVSCAVDESFISEWRVQCPGERGGDIGVNLLDGGRV